MGSAFAVLVHIALAMFSDAGNSAAVCNALSNPLISIPRWHRLLQTWIEPVFIRMRVNRHPGDRFLLYCP